MAAASTAKLEDTFLFVGGEAEPRPGEESGVLSRVARAARSRRKPKKKKKSKKKVEVERPDFSSPHRAFLYQAEVDDYGFENGSRPLDPDARKWRLIDAVKMPYGFLNVSAVAVVVDREKFEQDAEAAH